MSTPSTYKNEYLAVRYALGMQNKKKEIAIGACRSLIKVGNSIDWVALPNDISTIFDDQIGNVIHQAMEAKNQNILQLNVAQDAFFSNVITKDIQVKSEGIRSNALVYYSAGQFYKFNTSFMRYIKVLTGVNENEMNDFVIKYFISSVIRKNYSQFVDDVKVIANEYALYDYNIFYFLVKLFTGDFTDISEYILRIKRNVSDETFKLISQEDLSFIFSVCLLLDWNPRVNREMLLQNETLIYAFNEDFPKHYEIIQTYQKCRFAKVIEIMEQFKETKFKTDLILGYLSDTIFDLLKKRILKEILVSTSIVEIKYFKDVLKITDELVLERMIFKCIEQNKLPLQIDDISKCVYYQEQDQMDAVVNKALSVSKNNLATLMNFTLDRTLKGRIKGMKMNEKVLTPLEMSEGGENGDLREMQMYMMANQMNPTMFG